MPSPLLSAEVRSSFAKHLQTWFSKEARTLPWRDTRDPYHIWLSEVMLQQTRVAAVVEPYLRFVERFPTIVALALASWEDVLAAWSGLGYYRRARMMHRTAVLLVQENGGRLPRTAAELRALPGIGTYTSAAIASIAFGESVAVVDGNVERVLLRVLGLPEESGAAAAGLLHAAAQSLLPHGHAGDHNQAMMELGATVCLPKSPRCAVCPVYEYCRTRGEHRTVPRPPMQSRRVVYALTTRKVRQSVAVEVLMQRRPPNASLMPDMLELPQLTGQDTPPGEFQLSEEPVLRVRHAITGTNFYVEVVALSSRKDVRRRSMRTDGLEWVPVRDLLNRPLTGLSRKVLQRLRLMKAPGEEKTPDVPLLIGRASRAAIGKDA